ncbi:MAG: flagellar biosynthetic protein FliR [Vampirovibrionales bacterium]|nr:flagellar biosynthetic protein FliR [Vampirovibrionales bacterium]
MSDVVQSIMGIYTQYGAMLDGFLLVFARVLGFITTAPILNRKDVVFFTKLALAIFLTIAIVALLMPKGAAALVAMPTTFTIGVFLLLLAVNAVVGLMIGFIANLLIEVVTSVGDLINNQLGLSAAMMFDPASKRQVMVLEPLFGFLAVILFLEIGGMGWLLKALWRTFEVFPLYEVNPRLFERLDIDTIINLSGMVIEMATLIMAPVLLVTLAVDIMLAIVNRAAQQIPVFQLSFGLKPAIGMAVLLISLPTMVEMIIHFFEDHQRLF